MVTRLEMHSSQNVEALEYKIDEGSGGNIMLTNMLKNLLAKATMAELKSNKDSMEFICIQHFMVSTIRHVESNYWRQKYRWTMWILCDPKRQFSTYRGA